jgi:hypothetical protein
MKEATGELNMTVITLVAISAIGAVFYFLVWPMVQRTLASRSCETAYGPDFRATQMADTDFGTGQAKTSDWCCTNGTESYSLNTGNSCSAGN